MRYMSDIDGGSSGSLTSYLVALIVACALLAFAPLGAAAGPMRLQSADSLAAEWAHAGLQPLPAVSSGTDLPLQARRSGVLSVLLGRKGPVQLGKTWFVADEAGASPIFTIEVPTAATHTVTYLNTPDRFVLDIQGVQLPKGSGPASYALRWPYAERIRYSQFSSDAVRVVIDLRRPVLFELARAASATGKDRITLAPAISVTALAAGLDDGTLGPTSGAAGVFRISGDGPISIVPPEGPSNRLSFDITGAWNGSPDAASQVCGPITSIRLASSPTGEARVTADFAGKMWWDVRQGADTKGILVYLYPIVDAVSIVMLEGETCVLITPSIPGLTAESVMIRDDALDSGKHVLGIHVKGVVPPPGLAASLADTTGLVQDCTISSGLGGTDISLGLPLPVKPVLEPSPDGLSLRVRLVRPPLAGKTVIVDPGHGGSDPGATGATGLAEKAVVLDIAQKLMHLLTDAGANVVMTRDIDVYIPLGQRAALGGDLPIPADAFVSIHANSFTTPKPSGTETWYSKSSVPGSEALARCVQGAVVKAMGLIDRGLKTDERLAVTKARTIPSVLHEIAFISNVAEEALLADAEVRTKVACALASGIMEFLRGGGVR